MAAEHPSRAQRQVSPGVVERHEASCAYRPGRRRCSCTPTYRARLRVGSRGDVRAVTRGFPSRAEAEAWLAQTRERVRRGAIEERRPAPPLRDAAVEFLKRARAGRALTRVRRPYSAATLASYESALRLHVLPHLDERHGVALADLPVEAIDTRTAQRLVDATTIEGSASLARVSEAAVVAILRDLYGRGILDSVPPRPVLPPPPRPRTRRLSLAELDRLVEAAHSDDERLGRSMLAPLVAVLAGTGLRVSEALALRWGPGGVDLDADPPRITVPREATETGAGARTIGIGPGEAAVLRRHLLASGRPADGALLFVDERGQPLGRGGRVRTGLERIAAAAGVTISPHVLRHTHGSLLADAGQAGHEVAARLGHADGGALAARVYVHAERDRLADAPAALEALRQRKRTG